MQSPEVPVIKILICGEQRVGKSALLKSLHDKDFDDAYLPTTISDLTLKEVTVNDEKHIGMFHTTSFMTCELHFSFV